MDEQVSKKDIGMDFLQELKEWNKKEKEGRPPNESELAYCKEIQGHEKKLTVTRQMLRRARKKLKRATPNSEASIRAAKEVERYNEAMKLGNEVIVMTGPCPVLNCTIHPVTKKKDAITEVEATSCTDMDTESIDDENEPDTSLPVEENAEESEFQMVFPRKAEHSEETSLPIETENKYLLLAEKKFIRHQ
ncbi:hypothetical protein AVEN_136717-1 [Araneus ventricosus]|uniref:Uncharacterized protein n=1 Tax=Araneus ventricosus TaxID=182803 RepID=A0A4Y2EW75_ARAVE|nr:hypothetical protein AVEN_136717-1 [Araneus ventricosus]